MGEMSFPFIIGMYLALAGRAIEIASVALNGKAGIDQEEGLFLVVGTLGLSLLIVWDLFSGGTLIRWVNNIIFSTTGIYVNHLLSDLVTLGIVGTIVGGGYNILVKI